ncbi:MAG: flavohemoglobin expression-modulating QEGLA motif protein [Candidatus Brocadiales bacterium]|nr:flavohemoglobin expression-modulating QEGLA motif protein [Candidatus Brocadiales bacterium]
MIKRIKNGQRSGPAGRISAKSKGLDTIKDDFITSIRDRVISGNPIRRKLQEYGRVHIDRQLPFICVFRHPPGAKDSGTQKLVMSEASYLIASGEKKLQKSLAKLVKELAEALTEIFGSFLLMEIWESDDVSNDGGLSQGQPTFRLFVPEKNTIPKAVTAFQKALQDMQIQKIGADVKVVERTEISPPGLPVLIKSSVAKKMGYHVLGLQVKPIYRDSVSGELRPLVLQSMRRALSRVYKKSFYVFTHNYTTHRPPHYHSLGRRAMVKAVWIADQQLADISNGFDLLLSVTPTNASKAWNEFKRSRFQKAPVLNYRPLPIDPFLLKRRLFDIHIERLEDPALMHLFYDKQVELERMINLLSERGTRNFIYTSLQLYGVVDNELLCSAKDIIERVLPKRDGGGDRSFLDATAFAAQAEEEISYLRMTRPDIKSCVEIRDDIAGLMVSRGYLLIGSDVKILASRVAAALSHEVGTHILTYLNGQAQKFKHLSIGLPGYEELQEGLAVLSEYLVGGLSGSRLRLLAARVMAVNSLLDGASFVEVFRELEGTYNFRSRTAFNITLRIFRGGGFTKDMVYLRGLIKLLDYIKKGGDLDILFVGKFALSHVRLIQELQLRHVLGPPPLRPSYLNDPKARERLGKVRNGITLLEIIKEE